MNENINPTKICTLCKKEFPATSEYFTIHKECRYGLNARCKPCHRKRTRELSKLEHRKEKQKEYALKNKEKLKEYIKQWSIDNAELLAEKRREYGINNREILTKRDKEKRMKNPETYAAIRRRYKNKLLNTIRGRIMNAMHVRISVAIKSNKGGKSWQKIVGYSYDDLKNHLEKQFSKDMNWDNYGEFWHIDHIIPVASFHFDGKLEETIAACWALSNLRPLTAIENSKKRDSRMHLL